MNIKNGMTSATLAVLFVLLAIGVPFGDNFLFAADGKSSLKDAEKTYLSYYEDSSNIGRAIDKLNRISEQNSKDSQAMILLSRVWLTYGDVLARNRDEKLMACENGRDIAKKAIEISPNDPDAHFWYTANMGRWGETRGV